MSDGCLRATRMQRREGKGTGGQPLGSFGGSRRCARCAAAVRRLLCCLLHDCADGCACMRLCFCR